VDLNDIPSAFNGGVNAINGEYYVRSYPLGTPLLSSPPLHALMNEEHSVSNL